VEMTFVCCVASSTELFVGFHGISVGVIFKEMLSKCEFCEYQFSDSHTLFKGINDFVPVVTTFVDQGG